MFELITLTEAKDYMREGTGILVDVRPEKSYRKNHLPEALHVPLGDIMEGNIRFDPGKKILLYCDTGASSLMAARKLDRKGYEAYSISGGVHF